MKEKIREKRQQRANLIHEARVIIDTAEAAGRALTQEEENTYNNLLSRATTLQTEFERMERQVELEESLPEPVGNRTNRPDVGANRGGIEAYEWRNRGLRGVNAENPGWQEEPLWKRLFPFATDDYRSRFGRWLRNDEGTQHLRSLQVDLDVQAGFLVAPMQMADGMLAAMDNQVFMRQLATVIAVPNAESLGVVSLDNDPADPDWTTELQIGSEDTTMSVGKRELKPHPISKYIKVSRSLLRRVPSAESLVTSRLGYKLSTTMENAYLNGDGVGKPLGVFVASSNGISTARDVSTGNTATSMTFDGLIEAKYALKTQYWPRARWLFHRDGVKQLVKLKDGEGQYIWRESVRAGEPDRLLNAPTLMSEYAPNTFTASQYVGAFADFSYYWIADALLMEMQRLVELFAATNQVGIVIRAESDGMPVLEEAFSRVQLAAS